jgi:hypothetical protein
MAQSFDGAFSLLLIFFIGLSGISIFEGEAVTLIDGATSGFWLGLFGMSVTLLFFSRLFSLLLLDTTFGASVAGLRIQFNRKKLGDWVRLFLESFFIAAPVLWFLDISLRSLSASLGLRYSFTYENVRHLA